MNRFSERFLEFISMLSTYFGILLMAGAPISFIANLSDPHGNKFLLLIICLGMFALGFILFKLRAYIENKFDIYL